MKKIVSWVEREGVDGFLFFEDKDLRIGHTDPKEEKRVEEKKEEKKEDKKRQRTASLEASEKKFEKKR